MNVQTNATAIFTTNKLIQNSHNIMCEYLSSKGKHIPKFDAKLGRYAIKMLESDVARGALHFHTHTHTPTRARSRTHPHILVVDYHSFHDRVFDFAMFGDMHILSQKVSF